MDPELKVFLNSIKCPVCGGQIEGVSTFHCAFSKDHYRLYIEKDVRPIHVSAEYVRLNDGKKQFYIIQQENKTEIYVFKLNGDYQIIQTPKTEKPKDPIRFGSKLFDFKNTTREKLLNKVKTILVFS